MNVSLDVQNNSENDQNDIDLEVLFDCCFKLFQHI